MALFFDQSWFAQRLQALGLTKADLARSMGLSDESLKEVWKDQREVSSREVSVIAALLRETVQEVAQRCGISTPVPVESATPAAQIAELRHRIERLEVLVARLEARE